MEEETRAGTTTSAPTWRRIPWAVPSGRRLRFWPAVPEALLLGALLLSFGGGQIVGYVGFAKATTILGAPIVASYVLAAVVAVAYGVALIVTARARSTKRMPRLMAGLVGTPAARIWYGLAYVISPLIAWGVSFNLSPTATTQYRSVLWFAAPLAAIVCIISARICSDRDAKRAVLTGTAPGYLLSPDRTWWRKGETWASVNDRVWWNGDVWVRAEADAPDDALRSPDGNYWWTGSFWCPMPPIPKRRRGVSRTSVSTF
jgi:hypothetical protein